MKKNDVTRFNSSQVVHFIGLTKANEELERLERLGIIERNRLLRMDITNCLYKIKMEYATALTFDQT